METITKAVSKAFKESVGIKFNDEGYKILLRGSNSLTVRHRVTSSLTVQTSILLNDRIWHSQIPNSNCFIELNQEILEKKYEIDIEKSNKLKNLQDEIWEDLIK